MTQLPVSCEGKDKKIGLVISRFNEAVTQKLMDGATQALKECGVDSDNITVAQVPGAFELPLAAQQLAKSKAVDAVVCLGAIIRGQTPHFDYVSAESANGLMQVGLALEIPIIYGVLTTDNRQQALERAGGKKGNKGYDAVVTALEMVNLLANLRK